VRSHQPAARFIESVFCDIPFDSILGRLGSTAGLRELAGQPARQPLSSEQLDEIICSILADPFREFTPPDKLMSSAYSWHGNGVSEFREFVQELPKGIVRGKGFLPDGGKTCLFNTVMGDHAFEEFNSAVPPDLIGKVVFIFSPDLEESLERVVSRWRPRLEALRPGRGEVREVPAALEQPACISAD